VLNSFNTRTLRTKRLTRFIISSLDKANQISKVYYWTRFMHINSVSENCVFSALTAESRLLPSLVQE